MLERLGDDDAALAWLESAFGESASADYYVVLRASYYDDTWLALEALTRSPDLWAVRLPVAAPLRQDPAFVAIIEDTGLDDYWRNYGWGRFCEPRGTAIRCR